MAAPRVGLITFGDHRAHEWEHVFRRMTEPRHDEAVAFLRTLPIALHADAHVARTREEIDAQADALRGAGVELLVAHTPCWTSPNLVVRGVQRLGLPTLLLGNKHPGTHSTVGLLGAGGTLSQIGYAHVRVREDFTERLAARILPYARAAAARARLRGKTFGLFGGRSLGIDTGTFDPMQWKQLFGVDTEHIDQLEIIRRADHVSPEDTDRMVAWLTQRVGTVAYDGARLTPERLAFQARCYLATRQIIREMGLDFVAIKCMPDLTTHYVPQCLSAALLPGPFDADGPRDPIMMACEADGDAALTMEILKEVSGGKPVLFMDVSYLDDERRTFYFPNCGALCGWYAKRDASADANLSAIELRPANRPGGGAITYFTAAPGPLTLARLYRERGQYRMAIIPAETVDIPQAEYESFVQARGSHQLPTAFVRMAVDADRLVAGLGSNHILGVDGTCTEELTHFCALAGIEPQFFA
jgi:L-fucose isomerase